MLLAQVEVVAETTAQMVGRLGLLAFVMIAILGAALWGFHYILTKMYPAAIKRANESEDKAREEVKEERARSDRMGERFEKAIDKRDVAMREVLEPLTEKLQALAEKIDEGLSICANCDNFKPKRRDSEQTPIPPHRQRGQ